MKPAPKDPWSTDTADPARIFNEMFPSPAPRLDWRITGDEAVAKMRPRFGSTRVYLRGEGWQG